MAARPHIFIGSSKESDWIAKAARESLDSCGEVDVWTTEVFKPGHSYLSDLLKQVAISDFAVIVAAADDIAEIRGEQQWIPRDNVIFELGLFTSVLGPERAFILCATGSKTVKLPTDLLGHTFVPFRDVAERRQEEIDTACFKIQKRIEKLGAFRQGAAATIITRDQILLPEYQLRWTDIEARCREELLIVGWSCRNVISARTRNVFKTLAERKCFVRFLVLHPDVLDNPFDMGPVCHIRGEHIKGDIQSGIDSVAGCGKTRFEADSVPRNSLVSTAQPDKKEVCVDKTSSSWMCSATLARSSEYPKSTPCARFVS